MNADASSVTLPIRTLIVDDEPTARRGMRLLLGTQPDIVVAGEAGHPSEAVELITRLKPDLVLLDVQMPQGDGFDVIERVGVMEMPSVIFVTAYDDYALRAFEVNAIDYLLKPFEDERFFTAIQRARETVRLRKAEALNTRLTRLLQYLESRPPESPAEKANVDAFSDRILVKSSGEILFLKYEEIDWIDAEGDYMVFHVAGKTHLLRETMARLEARLDPKRFIRIHRSTIVNVDRVRKLTPSFVGEYTVVLHDGTKLKLSRSYQERLQEILKNAR